MLTECVFKSPINTYKNKQKYFFINILPLWKRK